VNKLISILSSIKLGIALIAAVAISCVWGSLIAADPKQGVDHAIVKVFAAPWFLVLVILLAVNLILCSWDKTVAALTLPKKKTFLRGPEAFHQLPCAVRLPKSPPLDQIEKLLRKHFGNVKVENGHFYAQKGILSRWGATIIHIGLLLVMGATLVRGIAGTFGWGIYDGNLIVGEGQSVAHYYTRVDRLQPAIPKNLRARPLPFQFRVLDFRVERYPNSQVVRSFTCLAEASSPRGSEIHEISMSDPLFHEGFKITLNSYQESAAVPRQLFQVEDIRTGEVFEIDASAGDPVRLPVKDNPNLFFEYSQKPNAEITYRILDLAERKVVEEGPVRGHSSPLGRAEALTSAVRAIPLALVALGVAQAPEANSAMFDAANTGPSDKKALLLALFEHGKLTDQQWIPVNVDQPTTVGKALLVKFVLERAEGMESSAQLVARGKLQVAALASPDATGETNVEMGDVVALTLADSATITLRKIEPETFNSPERELKTRTSNFEPASGKNQSGQAWRFHVVDHGQTSGYTVFLGIMRDPALPWFYVGCLVILAGVACAFFITYREFFAWYDPSTEALYCGLRFYRRESRRAHREFWQIIRKLEKAAERREIITEQSRLVRDPL
jgi:cytochrome c biogenesis protein ResB